MSPAIIVYYLNEKKMTKFKLHKVPTIHSLWQ